MHLLEWCYLLSFFYLFWPAGLPVMIFGSFLGFCHSSFEVDSDDQRRSQVHWLLQTNSNVFPREITHTKKGASRVSVVGSAVRWSHSIQLRGEEALRSWSWEEKYNNTESLLFLQFHQTLWRGCSCNEWTELEARQALNDKYSWGWSLHMMS